MKSPDLPGRPTSTARLDASALVGVAFVRTARPGGNTVSIALFAGTLPTPTTSARNKGSVERMWSGQISASTHSLGQNKLPISLNFQLA